MAKTLKIWNGGCDGGRGHVYIAAYSREEAARILCEFNIKRSTHPERKPDELQLGRAYREIGEYFAEGCWGAHMEGITPELGLWYKEKWNDKDCKPYKAI